MASKVHFNAEARDGGVWLGAGSSIHKNPAQGYGEMQSSKDWNDVDCKVCLKHKPGEPVALKAPSKEQMVAKKVKAGGNAKEAALFLDEIIQHHEGYNLAYSLHYHGYAGEKGAHAFAGIEL